MTKYSINRDKDFYTVEIKGHASYDDKGYDIVCASISTAIYMTRNFIEVIEPSYNLSNIKLEEGYALFKISSEFQSAIKALEVLEFTLKDLEKQYSEFIKRVI